MFTFFNNNFCARTQILFVFNHDKTFSQNILQASENSAVMCLELSESTYRHEMENLLYIFHFVQNRSYSPYRHIFARIKVHGIKAMSRGDLVGQTSEKLSIRVIAVEFVSSLKRRRRYQKCKIYSSSFDKFYSTINCYEDISGSYCIKIRFYRL